MPYKRRTRPSRRTTVTVRKTVRRTGRVARHAPSKFRRSAGISKYTSKDPFKPYMYANLTYTGTHTITADGGTNFGSETVYRLNSLYDPDLTNAGHQPYGFDTLTSIYAKYKVTGVSVRITVTDPSADGLAIGYILQPSTSGTTLQGMNMARAKETPFVTTKYINNTGRQITSLGFRAPIYKVEGITKLQYAADLTNFGAAYNADPASTPYIRFAALDTNNNLTATMKVRITLIYTARFWDRNVLVQS